MDKSENNKPGFWTLAIPAALSQITATAEGLITEEATKRLTQYGSNTLNAQKQQTALGLFFSQFKSPVTMILLFAAILSFFL
ncbi:MAG: hypothetical protein LUE98_12160 [Tannerellaceae bacterium]|nr:hypothetical protein [Tannerellaceae bacterium]